MTDPREDVFPNDDELPSADDVRGILEGYIETHAWDDIDDLRARLERSEARCTELEAALLRMVQECDVPAYYGPGSFWDDALNLLDDAAAGAATTQEDD